MNLIKKKNLALICDISDTHVSVSLVVLQKNGKPMINFIERIPITTTEEEVVFNHKASQLSSQLKKAMDIMASKIHLNSRFFFKKTLEVDIVLCTLSAPWYKAETRVVDKEYNHPITISKDYIDTLIKEELKKFQSTQLVLPENQKGVTFMAIEHKPVAAFLNGYHCKNPISKKAKKVSFTFYLSAVKKDFLLSIDRIIHHYIHPKNFKISTFPYMFFKSLSVVRSDISYAILVHVGGEYTDISYMANGDLVYTDTVSVGRNHLIRSVMKRLKVPAEVAVSYCNIIENGQANSDLTREITESSKKTLDEIKNYLTSSSKKFQKMYGEQGVDVYIVSESETEKILYNNFKSEKELAGLRIHMIDNNLISGSVSYSAHSKQDCSISLISLYANYLH